MTGMGAWGSTPEETYLDVWTSLLKKQGLKCDKRALIALPEWCKSHELDVTDRAALDFNTWEWAGRLILHTLSIGDEAAIC